MSIHTEDCACCERAEKAEGMHRDAERQCAILMQERDEARAAHDYLAKERDAERAKVAGLVDGLQSLKSVMQKFEAERDDLRAKVAGLKLDVDYYVKTLDERERQLRDAVADVEFRGELARAEQAVEVLKTQRAAAERRGDQALDKLDDAQAQVRKLREALVEIRRLDGLNRLGTIAHDALEETKP